MAGKTDTMTVRANAAPGATSATHIGLLLAFGLLSLLLLVGCGQADAQQPRPEQQGARVDAVVENGFARIVVTFPREVETEVRQANGILVIGFKQPFEIEVGRLALPLANYVTVARRDPDNSAIRLALNRKVTINSMAAGEKLFVDLLPEGWTALPPPLPRAVIEDLSRRAFEAEKRVRAQQQRPAPETAERIRVRAATMPTFTRYTFPLRERVSAKAERDGDQLRVTFDKPLKFDLADVRVALPSNIGGVEAQSDEVSSAVRFALTGKNEVRSFREEGGAFVVDVGDENLTADAIAPRIADAGEAKSSEAKSSEAKSSEAKAAGAKPDTKSGEKKPVAAEARASDVKSPVATKPGAPPPETTPAADGNGRAAAFMRQQGDVLRLIFPFEKQTAAAVFRRDDSLWIVFDATAEIDTQKLTQEPVRGVTSITHTQADGAQVIRLKLARNYLASATADGDAWIVTLADAVTEPSQPIGVDRLLASGAQPRAAITFADLGRVHRIADPESGETVIVVTGMAPARGVAKTQDFVEFRAPQTTHGIAIEPVADDLVVEAAAGRVVLSRPGGLTLTQTSVRPVASSGLRISRMPALDVQSWAFDRQHEFLARRTALMSALSDAPEIRRNAARLDIARFYLAREMYPEARGPLNVIIGNERDNDEIARALVLRGIASLMMNQAHEALRDFNNPVVGPQFDGDLWRALALSRVGRYADAREGLRQTAAASAGLPIELQRYALAESARCAIELGDYADAARQLGEFDSIGAPEEMKPQLTVLSGRIAEGLGRPSDALAAYLSVSESPNAIVAAQAKLRQTQIAYETKQVKADETIAELEKLTTAWRGDDTEVEALRFLANLYTEAERYRDAFHLMRVAITAHPNSPLTQKIQDQAAKTFEAIFMGDRGSSLEPAEALALFYDYRMLTPPGRRGDEMIRRLAERLVSMDLLKQASELLQHQVDRRLQGAARADTATRLATIYLMDRQPERALTVLRSTRMADLSNELRTKRLLLEARALTEVGRHDLALEIVSDMEGREVERLRADIHWHARHWQLAAEQIERMFGERWRDALPLDGIERTDILRAAIGFALADDAIGLDRLRQKYAGAMDRSPDKRLFEVLTVPSASRGEEFAEAARAAASVDTLTGFLRELRARFPEPGDRVSSRTPAPRS